jgi:hypothetical protein
METKKMSCENCRRVLDVGSDNVLRVEQGVIGTKKNFVNLDKAKLFCCEKCLQEYYDLDDLPSLPPRIP